jgi:hypothetical protein
MLNTPAVKAHATASPVSMSGTERTRVADSTAYGEPNAPFTNAVPAALTFTPETARKRAATTATERTVDATSSHRGAALGALTSRNGF